METDEVVFHKLPEGKKKKAAHKHNLMDAVTNIRGAGKKHWINGMFVYCLVFDGLVNIFFLIFS